MSALKAAWLPNAALANWATIAGPCSGWTGVFCQDASANPISIVTGINLDSAKIEGVLLTHLGILSTLTSLSLASNLLHGPVRALPPPVVRARPSRPPPGAVLTFLTHPPLSTRQIPTQIGALTSLSYLDISKNSLNGAPGG